MNINMNENAIIYKYNKYIQVNGTLFYMFEYLCQIIELELLNKDQNHPKTNIYICIPRKYQKDYLDKLLLLFRTKYPLWNRKIYRDKCLYENAKEILQEEKFEALKKHIQIVNLAFSRIKMLTSLELLKKRFNKVVFPCYNSFMDLTEYINPEATIKVIQNRKFSSLPEGHLNNLKFDRFQTQFLFEIDAQNPNNEQCNSINTIYYAPKLGFKYMVPKELFPIKYRTDKIVAGYPITNQELNMFDTNYQYIKPSLFAQVKNEFFLNTKLIEYHQNFLRWDENNRIILEARYLDIKLKVIKACTKDISNITINNTLVKDVSNTIPNTIKDNFLADSSVVRLVGHIENYTLNEEDYLIKFLMT